MKRLYNLPTYVIIGLLSIYYIAIFLNLKSLIKLVSGQAPFIIFLSLTFLLPIGVKGGMLMRNRNKIAFKIFLFFSIIITILFLGLILTKTDLLSLFNDMVNSEVLADFHTTIFGLISIITVYLCYFLLLPSLKVEGLIDSIKALPIASPVFCFGAPAFWKKSLLQFNLENSDISFLSILSFFTGIIFLVALLLHHISKNYNEETVVIGNKTPSIIKANLSKISLGLIFLAIGLLLFVCLDITYLIIRV